MIDYLLFWSSFITCACFKGNPLSEMTFEITFLSSNHTYIQLLRVHLFTKQCQFNDQKFVHESLKIGYDYSSVKCHWKTIAFT